MVRMQKPRVQFARTRDGVSIAYSVAGQGRPILFLSGWVSHLEVEVTGEPIVRFLDGLSGGGRRRVVRFDWRGTGLSDREVGDISAVKRVADLEAVIEALGSEKVAILAWGLSGPPALMYAAAHPERVSHLILYGTFASGATTNPALARALIDLIRADWTLGARTMVQVVARGIDSRMIDDGAKFLQVDASGEVAAAILEEGYFKIDVRDVVPQVKVPSLVLHRRDDPAVPFSAGRELAALLPDAHFLPLPGAASNPWIGDPEPILKAVDEFLADEEGEAADLFGTAVQAAARIAARARPGQILVADVVRQLAAGKPFRFNHLGRLSLKGFRERQRVFEVAY